MSLLNYVPLCGEDKQWKQDNDISIKLNQEFGLVLYFGWLVEFTNPLADCSDTFYLQLHGIRHVMKYHSGSERGNPLPPVHVLLSVRDLLYASSPKQGARCSSVVRAFDHGAMGGRIDPHGVDPLSYFLFQPISTTGVTKAMVCAILSVGWCI